MEHEQTPVGVLVRKLANLTNRYLAATMPEEAREATGGNAEIIIYLSRHEGEEIFPQDLEQRFGLTRSTISRVLALMERKGLIEREPVKRDARLKRIVLTDRARRIEGLLHANAEGMEAVMRHGLTDDDLAVMRRCLDLMRDNLVDSGKVGRCNRMPEDRAKDEPSLEQ